MIKIFFWLSVLMVFYVYIGYPLVAACIAGFINRKIKKVPSTPFVTILIAAFNEQEVIENTVINKLNQNYPADILEIIVISDGSTDGTDEIVRAIPDKRVRLMRQEPRAGKTSALNLAMSKANGDIIVFSDANSIYAPDAIRLLVENFSDSSVGYVTGKMIYTNPDGTLIGQGCSAYMRYENILRKIETRLGSIVGVDGGIDAVRKTLYQPMSPDQLPDFVLPLKVVQQGYRVVYEPEAQLWEISLKEAADEYRMRVRVSLRALWALFNMRQLLWNGENPLFAWQLWSHKLLRYLCFFFLAGCWVGNIFLLGSGWIYAVIFLVQSSGYIGGLAEPYLSRKGWSNNLVRFIRYFLLINFAAAHACVKFLSGKKQILWTPRKG